jgi:hypothetical protein
MHQLTTNYVSWKYKFDIIELFNKYLIKQKYINLLTHNSFFTVDKSNIYFLFLMV